MVEESSYDAFHDRGCVCEAGLDGQVVLNDASARKFADGAGMSPSPLKQRGGVLYEADSVVDTFDCERVPIEGDDAEEQQPACEQNVVARHMLARQRWSVVRGGHL